MIRLTSFFPESENSMHYFQLALYVQSSDILVVSFIDYISVRNHEKYSRES